MCNIQNIRAAYRTTQIEYHHLSSRLDVTLQLPQYFKNSLQVLFHRKLFPLTVIFFQSYLSSRMKRYNLVCGYSEFFCTETGVRLKINYTVLWVSTKTYVLPFQKWKFWTSNMISESILIWNVIFVKLCIEMFFLLMFYIY